METLTVLIVGILIGILVTAKPIGELLRTLDKKKEGSFAYIVLGAVLCLMTWVIGWPGFVCVLVTFVLYHAMREGLAPTIQNFFGSIKWPSWGKDKEPEPTPAPQPESVTEVGSGGAGVEGGAEVTSND